MARLGLLFLWQTGLLEGRALGLRQDIIATALAGLVLLVPGLLAAQTRVEPDGPDGPLRLRLDVFLPTTRIRAEIDGQTSDVGLVWVGRDLVVTLPDGVPGGEHVLVLYRRAAEGDSELGRWRFATASGGADVSLTGSLEAGWATGPAGDETRLNGSGRLGFTAGGGRWQGSLGFLQSRDPETRASSTEVTDWYLEHHGRLAGRDLILRLGTQELPAETLLNDQGQRRGLSFRLAGVEGRDDVMVFAVQPDTGSGQANLAGLSDQDDLVRGVAGHVFPFAGSSQRLDITAFSGRADLGSLRLRPGDVQGWGLRLSGPLAIGPSDYEIGYAETSTRRDGAALRQGTALSAEMTFGLLPEGNDTSLSLTFEGARVDRAFQSPLNPDLLSDVQGGGAVLRYTSSVWQWQLSGHQLRDNLDDRPRIPTEEYRDLGFDLFYQPDDFTGGWQNGMTFYASLTQDEQIRRHTPDGAASAQDFRLHSLSFGADKVQPDYGWSLAYTQDRLDDLTGRPDETRHRLEGLFAYTPDDSTTLTLAAELGQVKTPQNRYHSQRVEMAYGFDLVPDLWSMLVEAGALRHEDPEQEDGAYFGLELGRKLTPDTSLLLRADWGRGAEALELAPGKGWVFALTLRRDFAIGGP